MNCKKRVSRRKVSKRISAKSRRRAAKTTALPAGVIPLSIFRYIEVSPLEAAVKYLRENMSLSVKDTALMLGRSSQTITITYRNARQKMSAAMRVDSSLGSIPTSIIANDSYSLLESVVKFLKEERSMGFNEIGKLLNRDERNIWTVYSRATQKSQAISEIDLFKGKSADSSASFIAQAPSDLLQVEPIAHEPTRPAALKAAHKHERRMHKHIRIEAPLHSRYKISTPLAEFFIFLAVIISIIFILPSAMLLVQERMVTGLVVMQGSQSGVVQTACYWCDIGNLIYLVPYLTALVLMAGLMFGFERVERGAGAVGRGLARGAISIMLAAPYGIEHMVRFVSYKRHCVSQGETIKLKADLRSAAKEDEPQKVSRRAKASRLRRR